MEKTNKKMKMSIIISCILVLILILIIIFPILFTPKLSQEQRQEIINTFANYDNNGEVIYRDGNRVFLPDNSIDVTSIKYNGQECYRLISCGAESCYAYTKEKNDSKHVSLNLLEINYDDNSVRYIDTLPNLPKTNSPTGFCLNNKLYVGVFDGYYYIYDLKEKTYTTLPESEVVVLRDEQNQYEFNVLYNKNLFNRKYYGIEIIDKFTQRKKTITMENLNAFPEGRYILSLDSYFTNTFFRAAIEKDGVIYILGMIPLSKNSMTHQNVILKYDLENNILSYYSSMYYAWDEVPKIIVL